MIGKHVLYLLIICIGCTLAACNPSSDKGVKTKLTQAENIMYSAPDSALQLLEHLQPPKEKEQRATWALLLAQARYRNNVKQSDSLVNVAYMYFEKTDNAERKALALYLKGGLEKEAKHVNEAQALYLKAKISNRFKSMQPICLSELKRICFGQYRRCKSIRPTTRRHDLSSIHLSL